MSVSNTRPCKHCQRLIPLYMMTIDEAATAEYCHHCLALRKTESKKKTGKRKGVTNRMIMKERVALQIAKRLAKKGMK